jgi:hypothetical protein
MSPTGRGTAQRVERPGEPITQTAAVATCRRGDGRFTSGHADEVLNRVERDAKLGHKNLGLHNGKSLMRKTTELVVAGVE